MALDDWPALDVALAAAPAAEREHLLRAAFFRDPILAQWRYHSVLLARARAHLAAAAARPPREFPYVSQVRSWYSWQFRYRESLHGGSAPTARQAALDCDDEMRRLGVDKKYWTFSYDGGVPVRNQARVPRGPSGVNFELHAAARLPPARSRGRCQNPLHGCPNPAACWYQAELALCALWCAAAGRAHETIPTLTRAPLHAAATRM
jgi:hypothetical protein